MNLWRHLLLGCSLTLAIASIPLGQSAESPKILVGLAIAALTVVAWRSSRHGWMLFPVWGALAAYNLGAVLAGHVDCGCFSTPVSPAITLMVDSFMALGCLGAFGHGKMVTSRTLGPLAAVLALSAVAGWFHLGVQPARASDLVERSEANEAEDLPRYILVYRSDCSRCQAMLDILRFRCLTFDPLMHDGIEIDLTTGTVRRIADGTLLPNDNYEWISRSLKSDPLPQTLLVTGRLIQAQEDWSRQR